MSIEQEIESSIFEAIRLKDRPSLDIILSAHLSTLSPERWAGRCSPLHFAAFMGWTPVALKFLVRFPKLGAQEDEAGQTPFAIAQARGFDELAESLKPFAFPEIYEYKPDQSRD